jgi:hypothetical protein
MAIHNHCGGTTIEVLAVPGNKSSILLRNHLAYVHTETSMLTHAPSYCASAPLKVALRKRLQAQLTELTHVA